MKYLYIAAITMALFLVGCSSNDSTSTGPSTHSLDFIIHNYAPASAFVTIDSHDTRAIVFGDSTTVHYDENPQSVRVVWLTSAYNANNEPIGLQIGGRDTIPTAGIARAHFHLNVSPDYFFIRVRNSSTYTFDEFRMNYQTAYEMSVGVSLPSDGITYPLGYFNAFNNTVVWGHTTYWLAPNYMWRNGIEFSIPNTINQVVTLVADPPAIP